MGPESRQRLSLSKCKDSVTNDDTKGKEEARVNRHTKKNDNDEVELQGAIEELGNKVCCCGGKGRPNSTTKLPRPLLTVSVENTMKT